jgi:hypothetical protein
MGDPIKLCFDIENKTDEKMKIEGRVACMVHDKSSDMYLQSEGVIWSLPKTLEPNKKLENVSFTFELPQTASNLPSSEC